MTTPATPTSLEYYNDSAPASFAAGSSRIQQGLWWACHGLAGAGLTALRPGWIWGVVLIAGLLCHGWYRRPANQHVFQLRVDGGIELPSRHRKQVWRVRRAELGPWHVYLVVQASGSIARLCIYKDALDPAAWAALRRRLLASNNVGSRQRRC